MNTRPIKAVFYIIFVVVAAFSVRANNIINWGSPQGISGDSDVSTNGTLVGTYSPYLIVTGGSPVTLNSVSFQANSLNAMTSGMTNSTGMGINSSLTDAN